MDLKHLSESETRYVLIDPLLKDAGWDLKDNTQVRREIPVDGYDKEPWNGVTDYCLYDPNGSVLAVVEAKRCSRKARDADEQLGTRNTRKTTKRLMSRTNVKQLKIKIFLQPLDLFNF